MTSSSKQVEEKFNSALPSIDQASLGDAKRRKFNKASFIKAAQELQKVMRENDKHEPVKT